MKLSNVHTGRLFIATALMMLLAGVLFGVLASHSYIFPGLMKQTLGFSMLRPMHVSAVMFWILMGATGAVYCSLEKLTGKKPGPLALIQWCLWMTAAAGIFYSYLNKHFGGREYWEFDPVWALPLAAAWVLFIVNFIRMSRGLGKWPVYVWMWMTGLVFFMFTFMENYLWVLPYFRNHFVTDMTIQWKVNGSLVGSWNQLIYGTAFFLMDRISNNKETGSGRLAFAMYFLGLFNLMFNWGHHIYTLPTEGYVRYIGYGVSMTEWIIFAKIVYTWRSGVTEAQKLYHYYPYRFLLAADLWVLLNLGQGLLMSIPAFNLYTHGTHVTVAHAMGTTIGINSMILLAACFEYLRGSCGLTISSRTRHVLFLLAQASLLIFWLSLNVAGIMKGRWLMGEQKLPFSFMMRQSQPAIYLFVFSGIMLMTALSGLAMILLRNYFLCDWKKPHELFNLSKQKDHEQSTRTKRSSVSEPA
jgi:nitric oxide reductase subunit B